MRIVIDVTPLSHPRTGIGNYMLGHDRWPRRGCGRCARSRFLWPDRAAKRREGPLMPSMESSASAMSSPSRRHRLSGGGCGVALNCWMSSASSARWTSSTSPTGCTPLSCAGLRTTTVHDLGTNPSSAVGRSPAREHSTSQRPRMPPRTCDVLFAKLWCIRRRDVERTLGVLDDIVVCNAGHSSAVQARWGVGQTVGSPYLSLTAASFEPRKNLDTLLEAFALVRQKRPEVQLLIAGLPSGNGRTGEAEGVRLLGYVADEALARLYRGAAAFVFPSRSLRDSGSLSSRQWRVGRRP